jgi:hypothetical protein
MQGFESTAAGDYQPLRKGGEHRLTTIVKVAGRRDPEIATLPRKE